jgi:hypothetical protein
VLELKSIASLEQTNFAIKLYCKLIIKEDSERKSKKESFKDILKSYKELNGGEISKKDLCE